MGNRVLKESICTSDQIDELSWFEEVFFYRLLVNCDDYGVMDARPKILRSKLFPLKEFMPTDDIMDVLRQLEESGLIRMYEADGKPYLQVIKWAEHQRVRISKHKYPEPETQENADDDSLQQVAASCGELPRDDDEPQQDAADCGLNPNPNTNPNTNPNPNTKSMRARAQETDPDFDRFWSEYPNKVKKPNAKKAWDKLKPEAELVAKIMQGLARWKQSDQWTRDDGRFIPHPATWLNAQQWEDEIQPRRTINAMSAHNFPERDYSKEDEEARQRMIESILAEQERAMMG